MTAILKNRYDVITPPAIVWLIRNLAGWRKITCRRLPWVKIETRDRIPKPFSETGSSFISTVDWDISSKFGMQIDFHHFKRMQLLNLNSEVDFRLCDRHLEKLIWRQESADVRPITTKFRRRSIWSETGSSFKSQPWIEIRCPLLLIKVAYGLLIGTDSGDLEWSWTT